MEVDRFVRVLKRETEKLRLLEECSFVPPRELQEVRRHIQAGKDVMAVAMRDLHACRNSLGYGGAYESRILIQRIHRLWTVYELATACPGRDTSTGHRAKSCGEPMLPTHVVERVYELEYIIHVCTKMRSCTYDLYENYNIHVFRKFDDLQQRGRCHREAELH